MDHQLVLITTTVIDNFSTNQSNQSFFLTHRVTPLTYGFQFQHGFNNQIIYNIFIRYLSQIDCDLDRRYFDVRTRRNMQIMMHNELQERFQTRTQRSNPNILELFGYVHPVLSPGFYEPLI